MPHLTLEYSKNVLEKEHLSDLLQQCHALLAEELPTDIAGCKSRAYECQHYAVSDGQPNNAFVHLGLKVLKGRDASTLQNVGHKVMVLLTNHFAQSLQKLQLQVTIEISELSPNYFKITSGDRC